MVYVANAGSKEYENRVKYVEERFDISEQIDESQFETEMNEDDVKRTLSNLELVQTSGY